MRKIAMTGAGLALAAGVFGTVTPAQAASPCPTGAVCIRETNGTILQKNIFYSYGAHNLSNVTGMRVLTNNQTGGAGFQICKGYNGVDCYVVLRERQDFAPTDFTPINSVVLVR